MEIKLECSIKPICRLNLEYMENTLKESFPNLSFSTQRNGMNRRGNGELKIFLSDEDAIMFRLGSYSEQLEKKFIRLVE